MARWTSSRIAAACLMAAAPVALDAKDVEAWLDGYLPYALERARIPGAVVVVVRGDQVEALALQLVAHLESGVELGADGFLQRRDQRAVVDVGVLGVLGIFEQEVHTIGMRHHHDGGVGRHIEVVTDVAQRLGGLVGGIVAVDADRLSRGYSEPIRQSERI